MNFLQWELELKQSYLLDSEQTWAERFDRVAMENAALMVALQTRSDELRKVAMEKMSEWLVQINNKFLKNSSKGNIADMLFQHQGPVVQRVVL